MEHMIQSDGQSHWQVVAASVTGKSHEKQSLPCQDAHGYQALQDGVLVIAVADGAGSAQLSDFGAQIAVKTAVETVVATLAETMGKAVVETRVEGKTEPIPVALDDLWLELLMNAVNAARTAVEREAETQGVESRALATTLILTVATPAGVIAAQIGDGAVVVANPQGEITALTTPHQGEHLNETTFLTCPDALETAQFQVFHQQPAHLAIFSDGLQLLALKLPEGIPHQPFFSPLFDFVRQVQTENEATTQLVAFLKSPRVTERTDDDLTLVLAALQIV
ncbi:MAG: PP2C family serine/threonine-protein phosphatase [Microcoleaceae cyanobacterium]